jgi:hypothetical protein
MVQRAIPRAAIELMLDYGSTARVKGADSYFFDKAARRRVNLHLGAEALRGVERYLNAYAIVGDNGSVVTAAWRTGRLRRA